MALSGVTVDYGHGLDDTRLVRLNFSLGDFRPNPANDGWSWSHYWEANLSYWYLHNKQEGGVEGMYEAGITPNIRVERDQPISWARPFMEAGLGIHLLSRVHIGPRDLSSSFQFGTHIGLGVRFGDSGQWELAWRLEHLSNADLQQPNPGINFSMVRLGYHW